jgi:predicted transcriptional regulator
MFLSYDRPSLMSTTIGEMNINPIDKLLEIKKMNLFSFHKISKIPWATLYRASLGKKISLRTAKKIVKHCKEMKLSDFGHDD